MRPLTASSALDGTQPLFTQVPPTTSPSMIAVFKPCPVCGVECLVTYPVRAPATMKNALQTAVQRADHTQSSPCLEI